MSNELTFQRLASFLDGESRYAISLAFGKENTESMLAAFLRPAAEIVSALPCRAYTPELCGAYCPRNTIYMEEKRRFLSYCPHQNAPDEILPEDELRVYQPNLPLLLQRSAVALKIRPCVAEEGVSGVWRFGEFSPSAARKHPVFFITHTGGEAIQDAIRQLLLEYVVGPIVIFRVNDVPLESGIMRILQNRRSLLINIDCCLHLAFDGQVTPKVESKSIFASLAGKADALATPDFGYDFPAGTSWEDLLIHCQDDPEKVAFQIGSTTSVHTRMEMKIGKSQWIMLMTFAEKFGKLPSTAILQSDAMKKQRERLNKSLKEFFRTTEDAIVLSEDQSEYLCRFKIKPSWHSTIHHVKKRA